MLPLEVGGDDLLLPAGDLALPEPAPAPAAVAPPASSPPAGRGRAVQRGRLGDRRARGGHRPDGQRHLGLRVAVAGGGDGPGGGGPGPGPRGGLRLGRALVLLLGAVHATVGAAVEAAQAEVGAVGVALAGGPAVGHGAGALGVAQGVHVGALPAAAVAAAVALAGERALGQAVVLLRHGAVNVVPGARKESRVN